MYFKRKEWDRAGEWFAKAIQLNPDRETAYRYWGDVRMMGQNNREESLNTKKRKRATCLSKVATPTITTPVRVLSDQTDKRKVVRHSRMTFSLRSFES